MMELQQQRQEQLCSGTAAKAGGGTVWSPVGGTAATGKTAQREAEEHAEWALSKMTSSRRTDT